MLLFVFLTVYLLTLALQVFVPYIVRETIIFGVTAPEQNVKHPALRNMKKHYAQVVGISGVLFLMIMIVSYYYLAPSEFMQVFYCWGAYLQCLQSV
ncbi:hypothetical protein [Lysinibacillus sphaericus]|uniref:hypothetical protein n=1 Tax=Lysinibacillus sphaericus TaxID=1421 RepID=UPI001F50D26A|nr:hypothetical protein [Lysinibacillus sphaericus]